MEFNKTQLIHKTPTQALLIEKFVNDIDLSRVESNPTKFANLCLHNCRNYGLKYSCPPFSPPFEKFIDSRKTITVICYSLALSQYNHLHAFHRVRASNSILKSIIDHELLNLKEEGYIIAGSGSCRACKICGAKTKTPCKKPNRRVYSLEALGVDVDLLVKKCFKFHLQWYIPGKEPPQYNCVVGAYSK